MNTDQPHKLCVCCTIVLIVFYLFKIFPSANENAVEYNETLKYSAVVNCSECKYKVIYWQNVSI